MNADELKETTMDATKRVLKQVTIEDAVYADQVFDMLMGSDVAPRKSFIQANAKNAEIDINKNPPIRRIFIYCNSFFKKDCSS